jgi:hypothetical protein
VPIFSCTGNTPAIQKGRHPLEFGTMTIEWDGYEPYDLGIAGPPDTLPRAEARQAFKRCMDTKSTRLESTSTRSPRDTVAGSSRLTRSGAGSR